MKIFASIFIVLAVIGIYFFIKSETAPKPGIAVTNQGDEHISDSTPYEYNSNPPTSGSHNADWEKAGIYDRPLNDRKMVHSLEHGYVVISYNCDYKKQSNTPWSIVRRANAHVGENEEFTQENTASDSSHLDLTSWYNDQDCQNLVVNLSNVVNKKGVRKLVVAPRPNLDNRIALTAWTRLDKFYDFDEKRIIEFIDAFRDRGPEKAAD